MQNSKPYMILFNPLAARTTYGTIWALASGYTIAWHERDTTEKPMCHEFFENINYK